MIQDERVEITRQVNTHKIIPEDCDNCEHKVVDIDEAPEHYIDNEYIMKGYRINFSNFKVILKSLFMVHNELINVWSHLLGALLIFILVIHTSLYIKSHKTELYQMIDNKWDSFNEEIKTITSPLMEGFPSFSFNNITEDIKNSYELGSNYFTNYVAGMKNKTVSYFNNFEDKLDYYRNLINEQIQ
jgi:hypothetical protein